MQLMSIFNNIPLKPCLKVFVARQVARQSSHHHSIAMDVRCNGENAMAWQMPQWLRLRVECCRTLWCCCHCLTLQICGEINHGLLLIFSTLNLNSTLNGGLQYRCGGHLMGCVQLVTCCLLQTEVLQLLYNIATHIYHNLPCCCPLLLHSYHTANSKQSFTQHFKCIYM